MSAHWWADYLLTGVAFGSGVSWLVAFNVAWEHIQHENSLILALECVFFIIIAVTALVSLIVKVVNLFRGSANEVDVKTKTKTSDT